MELDLWASTQFTEGSCIRHPRADTAAHLVVVAAAAAAGATTSATTTFDNTFASSGFFLPKLVAGLGVSYASSLGQGDSGATSPDACRGTTIPHSRRGCQPSPLEAPPRHPQAPQMNPGLYKSSSPSTHAWRRVDR